jgi:hypothetical protein
MAKWKPTELTEDEIEVARLLARADRFDAIADRWEGTLDGIFVPGLRDYARRLRDRARGNRG